MKIGEDEDFEIFQERFVKYCETFAEDEKLIEISPDEILGNYFNDEEYKIEMHSFWCLRAFTKGVMECYICKGEALYERKWNKYKQKLTKRCPHCDAIMDMDSFEYFK